MHKKALNKFISQNWHAISPHQSKQYFYSEKSWNFCSIADSNDTWIIKDNGERIFATVHTSKNKIIKNCHTFEVPYCNCLRHVHGKTYITNRFETTLSMLYRAKNEGHFLQIFEAISMIHFLGKQERNLNWLDYKENWENSEMTSKKLEGKIYK